MFRFCRSKCHANFKMRRNPRKLRWTKAFRKSAGKEMAVDSTFEFEKRRNRPIKYDRNLVRKTIAVIKRVDEIKARRAQDFYELRMRSKKQDDIKEARREIERDIDIVQAPVARIKLGTVIKPAQKSKVSAAKKQLRERALASRRQAVASNNDDDDDNDNMDD